ncbi:MAG: hypothetical protein V1755_15790 [Chloroflexota bacterium]
MPADFPLNDGGLFYTMILDLIANGMRLPVFGTYNGAAIPYAYPPLGFYFYALLHLATHISVLDLMQFGPPIISAASIPAFYFLAEEMLGSRTQASLATVVYSLLPRAFEWLIMGGGVTRSLGMLFALLAMRQAYRLSRTGSQKELLPMIILGSLVIYSHPEAATHTAISSAFFYLWNDRSRRGLVRVNLVLFGIIIVSAPWWASVLPRHGLEPFLAVANATRQDSYNALVGLFALFRFDFSDEPFVTILTVLGLLGLVRQLSRREYLLPVWLVAMHTLEPRGGPPFMMIPLAMVAGIAVESMILPSLRLRENPPDPRPASDAVSDAALLNTLFRGRAARLVLGFLFAYGIMSAYATGWRIREEFTLTSADRQAFAWVRANAAPQSQFALVTQALPLRDASSEWFPALTNHVSMATVFGMEWVRGADFARRIELHRSLQACAVRGTDCLESWAEVVGKSFDYVYLRRARVDERTALEESLSRSTDFARVYSNESVVIYEKR